MWDSITQLCLQNISKLLGKMGREWNWERKVLHLPIDILHKLKELSRSAVQWSLPRPLTPSSLRRLQTAEHTIVSGPV